MLRLEFTSRVLGKAASPKLKQHLVTQTIRSPNSTVVEAFLKEKINLNAPLELMLDRRTVGVAKLKEVTATNWLWLTPEDAERGGFPHIIDLRQALVRAGYRFQALEEYQLYRVRFEWA